MIVKAIYRPALARLTGTSTAKTPPPAERQYYSSLTPESFRLLLDSGSLQGVRDLMLGGDPGADGLARFANGGDATDLRIFILSLNLVGGAEPLLRLHAPQLEELETQRVFIGDDAVARMCADGLLPRESLSLEDAGITSIGAVALAGCPRLANLQILNLNDNPIGADGIAAILTSPHLTQLQELRTSHTDKPREALLPVLFASPPRPTLSLNSWGHAFLLNRSPKDGTQLRVVGPRQGFEWPASGVCPEPLAGLSFEQFGFTPPIGDGSARG